MYTRYYDKLGPRIQILREAFYLDPIYWTLIATPIRALAKLVSGFLEPNLFDKSVRFVVNDIQRESVNLQRMQSGQIRSYIAWMLIGTVLLIAFLALGA